MIPRTVLMAQAVEALFTSAELAEYGNVIYHGSTTAEPNTAGVLAWQYKETTGAPVPLPSVPLNIPALKGWTNNYMEYFTRADSPTYNVYPGAPTMFEYVVHSYGPVKGSVLALGAYNPGSGYTPGTYAGVSLTSSYGAGATATIVVDANGEVSSVTLGAAGTGYTAKQPLSATAASIGGTGSGFYVYVASITPLSGSPANWAQCPRRFFQNRVLPGSPNSSINNPAAIPYSFLYPVADSPVAPPIDYVAP
jgi:hypothetical protein